MDVVNLAEKFRRFADHWSPKIVGDVNEMQVKLVKLRGEFVWHHHDEEDELFLVVQGRLRMQLRDGDREIGPGEFIIVPAEGGTLPSLADRRGARGLAGAEDDAEYWQREERADLNGSGAPLGLGRGPFELIRNRIPLECRRLQQ